MQFQILTLTGTKFDGEASEVSLRTSSGQIGILSRHEPLTAVVVAGPVVIHTGGGKSEVFASFGGLLDVTPDRARLLADEAEHSDDLIHEEIEAALAKAEKLKSGAKNKHELHRAQEMIDRHAVRLEVVRLRRHRHHRAKESRLG